MSAAAVPAEEPSGEALLEAHVPLARGFPAGGRGRFLFALALAFSAFQIATAAHILDLPSQIVRAVHVGFLLALVFPLSRWHAATAGRPRRWPGWPAWWRRRWRFTNGLSTTR